MLWHTMNRRTKGANSVPCRSQILVASLVVLDTPSVAAQVVIN